MWIGKPPGGPVRKASGRTGTEQSKIERFGRRQDVPERVRCKDSASEHLTPPIMSGSVGAARNAAWLPTKEEPGASTGQRRALFSWASGNAVPRLCTCTGLEISGKPDSVNKNLWVNNI